jgi:hypothetical protein
MRRNLVDTLRRPEHTGKNRCLPCTVVNAAIGIVFGALLSRKSKPAGVVAIVGSAVLIYLRGYLIPGTPKLTKRYLPAAVLRWFGKSPEADVTAGLGGWERSETNTAQATSGDETTAPTDVDSSGSSDEIPMPEDLEAYFLDADLLEPCEDRDDLCLTPSFESAWLDAVEAIDTDDVDLVPTALDSFGFDTDPDDLEFAEKDNGAYALYSGPRYGGKWPSYAALLADLAAGKLLGSWLEEWDDYAPRQKGQLLNSLRMFLETCPTAGGGVRRGEEGVESGCSEDTVVAVTCKKTGDRLFEHRVLDDVTNAEDTD